MGKYSEALRKRLRGDSKPAPPQQETIETEPHVQIDFWFGMHGSAQDIESMRPRFEQADVFIPEAHGYKPEHLAKLQAVANGTLTPEEALRPDQTALSRDEYHIAQLNLLAGSRKLILAIDNPFYENFDLEHYQEDYLRSYALCELLSGQFQRSVNGMLNGFARYVKSQHQREQLMLERLKLRLGGAKFKQWCQSRCQQKGSNNIQVLVQLGASHTKVGLEAAKTLAEPVTRHFSERPFVFPPFDTEYRRFIFGKNSNFDESIAEHILTQLLTHCALKGFFQPEEIERIDPNGMREDRLANIMARVVTRQDLEQFAVACQKIDPPINPRDFAKLGVCSVDQARQFIGMFCDIVAKHGTQFPTTEAEWVSLTS